MCVTIYQGRMSAEAADRVAAVTSSRPSTPLQTSWFEFLLDSSLLEKHLQKTNPGYPHRSHTCCNTHWWICVPMLFKIYIKMTNFRKCIFALHLMSFVIFQILRQCSWSSSFWSRPQSPPSTSRTRSSRQRKTAGITRWSCWRWK